MVHESSSNHIVKHEFHAVHSKRAQGCRPRPLSGSVGHPKELLVVCCGLECCENLNQSHYILYSLNFRKVVTHSASRIQQGEFPLGPALLLISSP